MAASNTVSSRGSNRNNRRRSKLKERSGVRWFLWYNKGYLPALLLPLAMVLTLALWPKAQDWELRALGYGWIPVILLATVFFFVARWRTSYIASGWRLWIASALAVIVSLQALSIINASSGVMETASLGGDWSQYLGGRPLALAALKIAAVVLAAPLLVHPKWAGPVYKRIGQWSWVQISRLSRRAAAATTSAANKTFRRDETAADLTGSRATHAEYDGPGPMPSNGHDEGQTAVASTPKDKTGSASKKFGWSLPPMDMLTPGEDRPLHEAILDQMSRHIEETLADHRVDVAVDDVRTGPRVIRFGLVPGWVKKHRDSKRVGKDTGEPSEMSRVKVQSILVREKDLALALKTPHLRIEAPVPGEALVGLEVPNPHPRTVALRSVAESDRFRKIAAKDSLPIALGEDTAGEPVASDLSSLPHLLIAGATGSGKSVCINTIVASLLMTCPPDKLRMVMVDPKRVELTPFNGIPHLVTPVIVDTDDVLAVLKAAQSEMLRRYKKLEEVGARNLEAYNRKASEHMPFFVIIIDELADLMMAAAYEVEQALVRLAQLGRATGIHLILATQRPSVNVVTGLLKANIPARVAFAVASQVDSRVILDAVGAEKLLGKGDALLLTSDSPKPVRVQGAYVSDAEIEAVVDFWKTQTGPPLPEISMSESDVQAPEPDVDDYDLLEQAREIAERSGTVTPSLLQRRLRIGYTRAVELVNLLNEEGLISGSQSSAMSQVGASSDG